jgi:hypothetical protein
MTTARFWTFENGAPVRVKIKAGQRLHHCTSYFNGEGWSHSATVWEFDGEIVAREYDNWGRDCDGGHGYSSESFCHVSKLTAGYSCADDGVTYPDWQKSAERCFDEHAEAAGY